MAHSTLHPLISYLKPGYQERKLNPLITDEYRNMGWCELNSDKIVQVGEQGQLAFVTWKK
jgi:putative alpha-1,2-mannosidase